MDNFPFEADVFYWLMAITVCKNYLMIKEIS